NALNIPYAELGMAGGLVTLVLALISIGVAWKVAAKEYEESAVRAREYYQTLEELRELYQEEQEDSLP
nr:hypothetical protein [Eubacterium sp.]